MPGTNQSSTSAALVAHGLGYTPVPIRDGGKAPFGSGWTSTSWESEDEVRTAFDAAAESGASGVGLLLGEPSGGLVDVDLDHPNALRLRDHLLPPTRMRTGRASNALSHAWYRVVAHHDGMATRRYKLPDGSVSVELRWNGAQTVIPPTIHPSGEPYTWDGPEGAWGEPAEVDGRVLSIQVALLGLASVLLDVWPAPGSRHEAYLALAGGLLRYGDGVHPWWERNLPVLIGALADVTHDDDGPDVRVAQVMGTTVERLRSGGEATGFGRLAELIGQEHVEAVRRMAREVEARGGFVPGQGVVEREHSAPPIPEPDADGEEVPHEAEPTPMERRASSWSAVELGPYISGEVTVPEPSILRREDGAGLFYPGRVNSLFGSSESAKTWIALGACVQEMQRGERVVFVDLEDEPAGAVTRLRSLGASDADMERLLRYVHPESPIAEMQRYAGGDRPTTDGIMASDQFRLMLEAFDPTLIVVDGMTVLYGLHGHDTNAATSTDVITTWLKSLTRSGRSGVIVIDHTGKTSGPGTSPIGAHHKVAMVQGTALRADPINRPVPGAIGTVRLVVYKDRPGGVRKIATQGAEQVAATVVMDSTQEGVVDMRLEVPPERAIVIGETDEQEQALEKAAKGIDLENGLLAAFGGDLDVEMTTTEAVDYLTQRDPDLGATPATVRSAWRRLRDKGKVSMQGDRRWTRYRLAVPYPSTPTPDEPEEEQA